MSSRIVIRTPNHLGDCIMALPMINETREAHPGATVTVLAPESLAELYEQNPAIDATIRIPTQHVHGLMAVVKIKEILSRHNFDIGYILPPSFGAAAGFKLAGIKERVGYIADGRRLLLTRPFAMPTPLNCQHRSATYFELLRRAIGRNLEYTPPRLFLNDNDNERAVTVLADFGLTSGERYACLAFRAVAESRRWGTANYAALGKELVVKYDVKVVLIGAAEDTRWGDEIVESVGVARTVNLAGKCSVRESAAVMARAQLFVGDDSGPAHMAAATGVPTIVLFGAGDPAETAPLGEYVRVARLAHLECIGCVRNSCPLRGTARMRCMTELTVPMVMNEVTALEKRAFGPAPR
ncbi:MAG: lipopolysaccharide heptosyltransferase II [Candidatus Zixiibacteriota bacterium]